VFIEISKEIVIISRLLENYDLLDSLLSPALINNHKTEESLQNVLYEEALHP
jgi:hypothetical protein